MYEPTSNWHWGHHRNISKKGSIYIHGQMHVKFKDLNISNLVLPPLLMVVRRERRDFPKKNGSFSCVASRAFLRATSAT